MFIIFLRFSDNRDKASEFMDGHNQWLQRGFDNGIFLLAGSIAPAQGGAILAGNISAIDLEQLINEDPFVNNAVVEAEITEISPAKTIDDLSFLLDQN